MTIKKFFNLSFFDMLVLKKYYKKPDKYVDVQYIYVKNKNRKIVSYINSRNNKLANIHRKINKVLYGNYTFSDCSFAYKKGTNSKDALYVHEKGKMFIRTDIKSFFESITKENLIAKFFRAFGGIVKTKQDDIVISSFFYNKIMPVGFITSPILSDIYMHQIDVEMFDSKVYYTRYSDDILLSISKIEYEDYLRENYLKLEGLLKKNYLEINDEKSAIVTLNNDNYIRYLGLNITQGNFKNKITVSNSFLRDILNYVNDIPAFLGKAYYVKQCSDISFMKLKKMYKIRFDEELNI